MMAMGCGQSGCVGLSTQCQTDWLESVTGLTELDSVMSHFAIQITLLSSAILAPELQLLEWGTCMPRARRGLKRIQGDDDD